MTRRSRVLWFGGAALLILAGVLAAIFVSDGTGEVLALILVGLGFVLVTSLVFLEVGLSEDRELERERKRRERAKDGPRRGRPRSRLGRMRGTRRRL